MDELSTCVYILKICPDYETKRYKLLKNITFYVSIFHESKYTILLCKNESTLKI